MREEHARLDLDSPLWDVQEYSIDGGIRETWKRIYDSDRRERCDHILDLLRRTEDQNHPTLAFHFASPYLVDIFEENFEGNWSAFVSYCGALQYAFNGPSGACLYQLWQDRDRISNLMLRGLEYLKRNDPRPHDASDCFKLFVACIATVFGDEELGLRISSDEM